MFKSILQLCDRNRQSKNNNDELSSKFNKKKEMKTNKKKIKITKNKKPATIKKQEHHIKNHVQKWFAWRPIYAINPFRPARRKLVWLIWVERIECPIYPDLMNGFSEYVYKLLTK